MKELTGPESEEVGRAGFKEGRRNFGLAACHHEVSIAGEFCRCSLMAEGRLYKV